MRCVHRPRCWCRHRRGHGEALTEFFCFRSPVHRYRAGDPVIRASGGADARDSSRGVWPRSSCRTSGPDRRVRVGHRQNHHAPRTTHRTPHHTTPHHTTPHHTTCLSHTMHTMHTDKTDGRANERTYRRTPTRKLRLDSVPPLNQAITWFKLFGRLNTTASRDKVVASVNQATRRPTTRAVEEYLKLPDLDS